MSSEKFQKAGPVVFISAMRTGKGSVMEMARTLLAFTSEIKKNMKKPAFKDIPARRMKEVCLNNIYDGKKICCNLRFNIHLLSSSSW